MKTIQNTFNWGDSPGRNISHVPDAEIKSAIGAALRSTPTQDELVDAVRQALGFSADSKAISDRILGILDEELLARRVCRGSDLRYY
jgi:hypothetical protein